MTAQRALHCMADDRPLGISCISTHIPLLLPSKSRVAGMLWGTGQHSMAWAKEMLQPWLQPVRQRGAHVFSPWFLREQPWGQPCKMQSISKSTRQM